MEDKVSNRILIEWLNQKAVNNSINKLFILVIESYPSVTKAKVFSLNMVDFENELWCQFLRQRFLLNNLIIYEVQKAVNNSNTELNAGIVSCGLETKIETTTGTTIETET